MRKRVFPAIIMLVLALGLAACAPKTGFVEGDDGKTRFLKEGEALTGFFDIDGERYYFDDDGVMSTGWNTVGLNTFYFDQEGKMVRGKTDIDGVPCLFDEDGRAVTGIAEQSGTSRYYEEGRLKTGWISLDGVWHYFEEDGTMVTGLKEINGDTFVFDNKGVRQTGILTVSGKTLFFDEEGKLTDGFQVVDGGRYYFDEDGMAQGFREIAGNTYYFGQTGAALTGWQEIDSKRYYFSGDCIMAKDVTVEGNYIGPDGVSQGGGGSTGSAATGGETTGEGSLDDSIKEIIETITKSDMSESEKLEAAYMWVVDKLRYKYITVDLSEGYTAGLINELAKYTVDYRAGSCEHYAAVLYVLFERLGVSATVVEGDRFDSTNGTWGEHAWVIAEVGGKNYHFDPLFGRNHTSNAMSMFMAGDSALEGTHSWNRDFYPACG